MKRVFFLAALAAASVGCGGSDGKVDTVTAEGVLSVDGKPHGPTKLVFTPTGDPANRPTVGAQVGADGKFAVSTYGDGDGAPPGKYQVSVSTTDAMSDPAAMGKGGAVLSTNSAEIEIPADGTSDLKVDLKSSKSPTRRGGSLRPLGT